MSNYEGTFVDKLNKLTNTQQSIQSLSYWVMYHKKKCDDLVQIWKRELLLAQKSKIVLFLHLCNDVIQNSRKKTDVFVKSFENVLEEIIEYAYKNVTDKNRIRLDRLLNIWEERKLFSTGFMRNLKGFRKVKVETLVSPTHEMHENHVQTQIVIPLINEKRNINENPIIKAVNDQEIVMLENSRDQIDVEDIVQYEKKFSKIIFPDLERLDISELKTIQSEFLTHEKTFENVKNGIEKYKNTCEILKGLLSNEIERQNKLFEKLSPEFLSWTTKTNQIKDFLTQIELSINSKEIDDFNDFSFNIDDHPSILKKRPFDTNDSSYQPFRKKQKVDDTSILEPPEFRLESNVIDQLLNI